MVRRVVFTILVSLSIFSCTSEPQLIKEDELQNIIRDMLITDVFVTKSDSISVDSFEYFSPILKKYGYSAEDIDYTLRRYALRKSGVLGPMLDNIATEFDSLKRVYNNRGDMLKVWGENAKELSTKVVLFIDSIEINSLEDRQVIELPIHFSGDYTITYSYRIDSSLKKLSFATSFSSRDTIRGTEKHRGRYWMSWGKDQKRLNSTTSLDARKYNMMEYSIPDPPKSSDNKVKIRIDSLKITYLPTDGHIEEDYLNYMLALEPFNKTPRELTRLFNPPLPMAPQGEIDSLLHHIDSLTLMLKGTSQKVPFIDNSKEDNIKK